MLVVCTACLRDERVHGAIEAEKDSDAKHVNEDVAEAHGSQGHRLVEGANEEQIYCFLRKAYKCSKGGGKSHFGYPFEKTFRFFFLFFRHLKLLFLFILLS